jgi:hypothetical protein
MVHLTFLFIFHLKTILCQNFNLLLQKKTHFWYDNYQIFHMVHKLITISNSLWHEFKLEDAYQEVTIVGICCYFQWIGVRLRIEAMEWV